ncbi:40S ribosomal protein S2-like [Acomys russatus]|uniref:40S ribosomal protein S2-like n=1 Tax=Acomys russatus TaxID=60746 RepID=UPI0021E2A644|nr:40S ribosomal protein S2-like [Acomys russatus]
MASSSRKYQMMDDAADDKEWIPATKLGCLVKDIKIRSLEEIHLLSLPIKESKIIDFFLGASLKDEVTKIRPVQNETWVGQQTTFKAFDAIGDYNGHIGLGVKCSEEVATDIQGAIILAKLSIVPVRRGYWRNKIGKPHIVLCKVTFDAISKTYSYLTSDLWKETVFTMSPYQEFTDHLVKTHTRVSVQRT